MSSVSAPLIVVQTFVPALIGVVLLGDEVRAGWWPAILVGLVLATGGAIVLSGDGITSPVTANAAEESEPTVPVRPGSPVRRRSRGRPSPRPGATGR